MLFEVSSMAASCSFVWFFFLVRACVYRSVLQDGEHLFYSTFIFKNYDANPFKLSWEMQCGGRLWWAQVSTNDHNSTWNVICRRYWWSSCEQSYVVLVLRQPQTVPWNILQTWSGREDHKSKPPNPTVLSWKTFQVRDFRSLIIPKPDDDILHRQTQTINKHQRMWNRAKLWIKHS